MGGNREGDGQDVGGTDGTRTPETTDAVVRGLHDLAWLLTRVGSNLPLSYTQFAQILNAAVIVRPWAAAHAAALGPPREITPTQEACHHPHVICQVCGLGIVKTPEQAR